MSTEILMLWIASTILITLGVLRLKHMIDSNPRFNRYKPEVDEVFHALQPFLYRAIISAQLASDSLFAKTGALLDSSDKKAIADGLYAHLPDVILVGNMPVPVGMIKTLVTQTTFEAWIKTIYDEAKAFTVTKNAYIDSALEKLANSIEVKG